MILFVIALILMDNFEFSLLWFPNKPFHMSKKKKKKSVQANYMKCMIVCQQLVFTLGF